MSDPSPRSAEGSSIWQSLRELLNLKSANTLRESIEEAIDEHAGIDAEPGDLDLTERTMLRNMLHLSEQKVADIAVPRADIMAIAEASDFKAIVAAFQNAGHSRLPLYRRNLDEVIGMLHVKDVYAVIADYFGRAAPPDEELPSAEALMRPVLFVPPSMRVADLLADMRRNRTHMAIIVDEFGGVDGLATIEDIIEEIVGEIEDEHDEEEEIRLIARENGIYEADARLALDDLEDELGVDFVEHELGDEVDTLGGLAVLIADRVPVQGDILPHSNGWRIEVLASDGRRVERLLLHPPVPPDEVPQSQ